MKLTKFPYISHTEKDGYVWKKRINDRTVYSSLKSRDLKTAQMRAASLTGKMVMVKKLNLPFDALRLTLRRHRDELVDMALLEILGMAHEMEIPVTNTSTETSEKHGLVDVLEDWCKEMHSDWKPRTEKLNRRTIDLFIEWAKKLHIHAIEDVNKETISSFKKYLDKRYEAPRSRKDALINVHALFSFCVEKRDWLTSNPVKGMLYAKVETINKKNETTPESFMAVMNSEYVQTYQGELKWLLAILWNTGMRIGEAIQLRPQDYREIDGVKVISINDEDGKSVKNASSIRNIPISEALLNMGLWEAKPFLGWGRNNAAASRVAFAFSKLGLKHSTHDFRYSLSKRLRDCEVPDSIRYSILSHAHSVTTDRVYVTRQPLMQMKKALYSCSYGVINVDEEVEEFLREIA